MRIEQLQIQPVYYAIGIFRAIFFGIVLLVRLFGAWMLRISEIIHLQQEILDELRKMNARLKISFGRISRKLARRPNNEM